MPQDRKDFEGLPAPGEVRAADVVEELGDGLILRRAHEGDVEALAVFNAVVQADPPGFERLEHVANWTRQLMDGSHPFTRAPDFLLVHDVPRKRIASTLGLLEARARYSGVEFGMGQPELVGSHPAYRHRGLIARLFAEIHRVSEARGDLLQAIDGIPWYYRQFGYEMAAQRFGGRKLPLAGLPTTMPRGLRVRPAREDDAPFIAAAYATGMERYRLTCVRDEAFWRFEINGRHGFSTVGRPLQIVESRERGRLMVFNCVPILLDGGHTWTTMCEAAPGVGFEAPLVDAMFARLIELGRAFEKQGGDPLAGALLVIGDEHPLYGALSELPIETRRPYAWYLRVPDLAAFLLHVAPALANRLAGGPFAAWSGHLELSRYVDGVRLRFEDGHITAAEAWRPATDDRGDAAFPDWTFLHLLFGHRSLAELEHAFPDCQLFESERRPLLEALFPIAPAPMKGG